MEGRGRNASTFLIVKRGTKSGGMVIFLFDMKGKERLSAALCGMKVGL
jgi:hypothetical protein